MPYRYRLRNKFLEIFYMLKALIPAYTLLLQFLHLVQIEAKWIHSYQMPFGSIKMGFVKINVLCSPFERTVTNY